MQRFMHNSVVRTVLRLTPCIPMRQASLLQKKIRCFLLSGYGVERCKVEFDTGKTYLSLSWEAESRTVLRHSTGYRDRYLLGVSSPPGQIPA